MTTSESARDQILAGLSREERAYVISVVETAPPLPEHVIRELQRLDRKVRRRINSMDNAPAAERGCSTPVAGTRRRRGKG